MVSVTCGEGAMFPKALNTEPPPPPPPPTGIRPYITIDSLNRYLSADTWLIRGRQATLPHPYPWLVCLAV